MNESNSLVAAVMEKLPEVRAVQLQMRDPAQWGAMTETQRNEVSERCVVWHVLVGQGATNPVGCLLILRTDVGGSARCSFWIGSLLIQRGFICFRHPAKSSTCAACSACRSFVFCLEGLVFSGVLRPCVIFRVGLCCM